MDSQLFAQPRSVSAKSFKTSYQNNINFMADYVSHDSANISKGLASATALGSAIVEVKVALIVGSGLTCESSPELNLLPKDVDEKIRAEFNERADALWRLYCKDPNQCDKYGKNDFYRLQQIAYKNVLLGDCLHYRPVRKINGNYVVLNQIIAGSAVGNPNGAQDTKECMGGVKCLSSGEEIGYYVQQSDNNLFNSCEYVLVPRKDSFNRVIADLIHIKDIASDQKRGKSVFASVSDSLLTLSMYSDAEVQRKLAQAIFAVFITHPNSEKDESAVPSFAEKMQGIMPPDDGEPVILPEEDKREITLKTGVVTELNEGEDVKMVQPSSADAPFETFYKLKAEEICSSIGLSTQTLFSSYNSNYSASRATIEDMRKRSENERDEFASKFCDPVRNMMIEIWVRQGLLNAPHYFESPIYKKAWNACTWTGPTINSIDPLKEINAYTAAINAGLITHEYATQMLYGRDSDEVAERLSTEIKKRTELGLTKGEVIKDEE